MAPHIRPEQLVFRCYARRERDRWVAHCIDLDLCAVGSNYDEARDSLHQAISGYFETVITKGGADSIPRLLRRRAPLRYRIGWELRRILERNSWRSYEDLLPIQLAPAA